MSSEVTSGAKILQKSVVWMAPAFWWHIRPQKRSMNVLLCQENGKGALWVGSRSQSAMAHPIPSGSSRSSVWLHGQCGGFWPLPFYLAKSFQHLNLPTLPFCCWQSHWPSCWQLPESLFDLFFRKYTLHQLFYKEKDFSITLWRK